MTQLTIRGFDPELERALRRLAQEEGISLSRAAIRLMRQAAGLGQQHKTRDIIGTSLDRFIGTWSTQRARQVTEAVKDLEHVDESLWR